MERSSLSGNQRLNPFSPFPAITVTCKNLGTTNEVIVPKYKFISFSIGQRLTSGSVDQLNARE